MMNVIEDMRNEFKVKLTEKLEEEVIAFLNTDGGNVFVGVSDNGQIVGVNGNIDLLQRTIIRNFKYLIDNHYIERIGANKNGYWKIKI